MIKLIEKKSELKLTTPTIVTGSGGSADLSNYYTKSEVDAKIDAIPQPDLTEYAKKSEIPDVSGFLTEIPEEYVTESELDAKGYLTSYTESDPIYTADKPNIALKSEIPTVPTKVSAFINDAGYLTDHQDLSDYAFKTEIPDVSGFITEIPEEYITETELNAKGYLTEHQSLDGYAKTTDIPDVSGYQTEAQVQALIDTAIASITDAEAVSY